VRVVPRAGRSGIDGMRGGSLLIRLSSAPADGAANAELIEILARALHVPKRDITIVSGERSRQKRIRVTGFTRDSLVAGLGDITK
jgi:uncharacterized protein (TIGR00251 family)